MLIQTVAQNGSIKITSSFKSDLLKPSKFHLVPCNFKKIKNLFKFTKPVPVQVQQKTHYNNVGNSSKLTRKT